MRVPHFLSAPRVVAETDTVITLSERAARAAASASWHARNDADPAHTSAPSSF
jgi:hypothetical protein